MSERFVVIMAGGRGERFWPESRSRRPKQLLPIVGDRPMLAQTVARLEGVVPPERVIVITNAEQRAAVLEACPELDPANVVGEPVGRDTAAAVGLATVLVRRKDPEAAFAMLPADAVVGDDGAFREVLEAAFRVAEAGEVLVTIGIPPRFPATGYGYIHRGESVGAFGGREAWHVRRFVEKPDLATARSYLEAGGYYWNAGMFVWTVSAIDAQLRANTPALRDALGVIEAGLVDGGDLDALLEEHYPGLEKISIDYAVIEKARNIRMVEATFDWDDVGEWPAVDRHHPSDADGNVAAGTAYFREAARNTVYSRDPDHLVAVVGVDDMVVVHTADATLVCPKAKAQEIKALVRELGAREALARFV